MIPSKYSLLNSACRSSARYSCGVYRFFSAADAMATSVRLLTKSSHPSYDIATTKANGFRLVDGPPALHGDFAPVSAAGSGTWAGLARYETSERISNWDSGFKRSSGIIDCSLVRRSLDLVFGEDDRLVGGDQGDRVLVFGADDSGEHAAVGGGDHVGLVVLADQGARVEDVGEQVVEVCPVRAGQVGPDLAADAEERVALLANLGEDGTPERAVGGLRDACP